MARSSFGQQLRALIKRNFLLKYRKRLTTCLELMLPVLLIIVILPQIRRQQQQPGSIIVSSTIQVCVFPDEKDVQTVGELIKRNFQLELKQKAAPNLLAISPKPYLIYLNPNLEPDNITLKLRTGECDVVTLFKDNIRHNGSYEIRIINEKTVNGFDFFNKDLLLSFKRAVDSALIQFWSENFYLDLRIPLMSLVPAPGIREELPVSEKQRTILLPLYLVVGYSFLISVLCLNIVQEKERKIKETNVIMGLSISAYWIAWFLVELTIVTVVAVLQVGVLHLFDVFQDVNLALLFVVLELFGCSIIFMAFMMTPFFKSSKTAASVSSVVSILTSLFYLMAIFASDVMTRPMCFILSILSPSAFTLAIQKICEFNIRDGFNYHTLFEGKFSVADAMLMLAFDIVFYGLLTYILDNFLSEEILGFCGPSCCHWKKKSEACDPPYQESHTLDVLDEQVDVEPGDDMAKEGIRLESVRKIYNPGKKTETKAIDGLTLDIYKGQITALLGHNGAGKTTLIKVLTGNVKATSGKLIIGKDNIRADDFLHYMRHECGVCPQENILFDQLSAREHLIFYGEFKGLAKEEHASVMSNIITSLELAKFMETPTKLLSGAEKRKVCLAIALMTMPKFLFLDEPTSGLDPDARRKVWSALRNLASQDKTIILTTHDMEEADILADRKAVISKGKLRCVGSSMYLKMKFGIGYHLGMTISSSCDAAAVLTRIQVHNAKATSIRQSTNEMKVVLPSMETSSLTNLLLDLENYSSNLGVLNYGISLPTLEEVFHKLDDTVEEKNDPEKQSNEANEEIPLQQETTDNSTLFHIKEIPSCGLQCLAFLKVRFLLIYRYPSHVLGALTAPLMYVLIALFLIKVIGNSQMLRDSEVSLDTKLYARKAFSMENNTGHAIENVMKTLRLRDFKMMNGISNLNEKDFIVEIIISTYDTSVKMANISWKWTYYPFHRLSQLVTLNLMSNVIWDSMNVQNESKYLSTNLREVGIAHTNFTRIAIIETVVALLCLLLGSIHVACLVAVEALCDRTENVKNQLYISGFSGCLYWFPTLLAHTIFFIVIMMLMCIFTIVFQMSYFHENPSCKIIFWAVIFLNTPALLLYVYIFSFLFRSHHTAYSLLPSIFTWLTILTTFIVLNFKDAGYALYFFMYLICPFFAPMGAGLLLEASVLSDIESDYGIAVVVAAIISGTFLYSVILIFVDTFSCEDIFKPKVELPKTDFPEEDEDVKAEKEIMSTIPDFCENQHDVLRIKNLMKVYNNNAFSSCCKKSDVKTAIQSLSFSIKRGEIFGLLGPVGAGKTSTIKVITGEEKATHGKVFIGNKQVTRITSHKHMDIAYCPQQDALWKRLTLEEHLKFYSILKGIPPKQLTEFCERVMDILNLKEHRSKVVKELSGGTKRKLSSLLSMFGTPKLLLLDEPSSGIDPVSKRKLWNFIQSHFPPDSANAALLTTHSMEEAEAICTRIGIMVNGILGCIGSVQHLKDKYGNGYVLQFRLPVDLTESTKSSLKDKLEEFVNATFPKAKLKASSGICLTYNVPKEAVFSLADAFQALETAKREHQFPDYTFSQSTLEQVFLELTKEQEEVHLKN